MPSDVLCPPGVQPGGGPLPYLHRSCTHGFITVFSLLHRALPVMYAVALDLRVFANNVSLVSTRVVLRLKLSGCCFNLFFFPKVSKNEWEVAWLIASFGLMPTALLDFYPAEVEAGIL